MTNRIQLRRDTTDNWTRVNPILEDGEPGLDIDTNQIKYGDGSTVWNDLSYASTGSGIINGSYSVSIDQNGTVTMETSRGNLEFGALPEVGGPTHFHIMRTTGQESSSDLYFGDDYNYIKLPADTGIGTLGVEIGAYASNQYVWRFDVDGGLDLPSLLSNQGRGNVDSTNNVLSLMSNDTVDFHDFSGMILVNCHNSGNITLYLCGGGAGSTAILGSSKITNVGALAFNAAIGGYTFTADETGDHVFFTIRTRTGA